jgi:GH15 family glucan-1,4-alpha-glucosidase
MGRHAVLSNGKLLVGLDEFGSVHDFYYPYVGQENLTSSRNLNHKIGIWVEGQFSWLDDGSWQINVDFETEALISNIEAVHQRLKIRLQFQDFVDYHYAAFGRQIEVFNLADERREIRVFMHQAFQISRTGRSDTALYVPDGPYLLDYKGWSSILIYLQDADKSPFDQFAVGNCGIEGKEGTFKDAEDGELSGSLVEHGGVDSVMRSAAAVEGGHSARFDYWLCVADSQQDAEKVHEVLRSTGLSDRLAATRRYWADWLSQSQPRLDKIPGEYQALAKKSLLLVKAHQDRHGGVIASSDSSIYNYGRDYYNYVWPRDGAYALMPLIELGYKDEPRKFFDFCADTRHPDGYMMHKYQPDRSIGSTWHPLLHLSRPELPIQEDETSIVVLAVCRYYQASKDEDYMHRIYDKLVAPGCDFMAGFIDVTNLPHASYDLWEQKFATFTYTTYLTLAALSAAAEVADKLGKHADHERWQAAAERISRGLDNLVNDSTGAFRKSLLLKPDASIDNDDTVDASSFFGALQFSGADKGVLEKSVRLVEEKLLSKSPIGGVPRYEGDDYFRSDDDSIGNPWLITTLWLARYYVENKDISRAKQLIDWVAGQASPSGMFPEQVDAATGKAASVCPLVWSHSTFIETVLLLAD